MLVGHKLLSVEWISQWLGPVKRQYTYYYILLNFELPHPIIYGQFYGDFIVGCLHYVLMTLSDVVGIKCLFSYRCLLNNYYNIVVYLLKVQGMKEMEFLLFCGFFITVIMLVQ